MTNVTAIVVKCSVTYQHLDAVSADDAHQDGADDAEPEPSVLEGVGHRQDPGAQAALEQMQERARVPGIRESDDLGERVMMGGSENSFDHASAGETNLGTLCNLGHVSH